MTHKSIPVESSDLLSTRNSSIDVNRTNPQTSVHVGPEGFGPYIGSAIGARDSKKASQAARWIRACAGVKNSDRIIDELRSDPSVSKERFESIYSEHQSIQRLCQTVTDVHFESEPVLDLIAMQEVRGHAAPYLARVGPPSDPQTRSVVIAALKADADAGDWWAIYSAAYYGVTLGLSEADIFVYGSAYQRIAIRSASVSRLPLAAPKRPIAEEGAGMQILDERIRKLVDVVVER